MYERCLNEAEVVLSVQPEPIMPVRKVWEEITKRSKLKGFEVASLSDFSAMLEGDSRFQIVPALNKNQEGEEALPDTDLEDTELEQLGFFAEDRVKLRRRKLVEAITSDEDEEVGSIRRKSFATQAAVLKKLQGKKLAESKKSQHPVNGKKTSANKRAAQSKPRKKIPAQARRRRTS